MATKRYSDNITMAMYKYLQMWIFSLYIKFTCQRDIKITLLLSETLRSTNFKPKSKGINFQKSCHPLSVYVQSQVEATTPQSR